PMRCAETDEAGHHVDVLLRIGRRGHRSCLGGGLEQLEAVAEPLYGCARNEDRAFERISRLTIEAEADGREQAVLRADQLSAGIQYGEAARAVRGFHHARIEASLTDQRRLLVAGNAPDRDCSSEQRRL